MSKEINWDKAFSTYWWQMDLNPNNPNNKPNVAKIRGYSKVDGHDEPMDKHHLLKRCVLMMFQRNYISRSNIITIYARKGSYINFEESDIFLELFPTDFCVSLDYKYDKTDLSIFLKKIYNDISQGKQVDYLLPKPKTVNYALNKEDKLDPYKYNFRKFGDVNMAVAKLESEGVSHIEIANFYKKSIVMMERNRIKY